MSLLEDSTNYTEAPDEKILVASLDHPDLFGLLVDRYQDAFLRKAEGIVHSREEAEDIVQETFAKIYFNARRYTPQEGATFRSWAYKILVNTTFTHYQKLKKKGSLRVDLDPEIWDILPDPAGNFYEEESMRDYVASFLSKMPDVLARPLRLHFIDEYSQKEIAEMEGTTVSAIKTRIYRAKREFIRLVNGQQSAG
ncbi:MAG: RNA polymerase sigma factor [Candidatus Giovannonibacteria bacterium GW2011_GWA2_53_7]|uniref:RNA polymerase sigma factor n=1 Tax=Candidatus Giovannonibacteria bacterium GW2011_GWA2_53_7 TaxID=1618650 RepID=A0A0G2AW98_9BACT|nr:MAG: RNA polymerase sigma factor [Candidatus Giovannonibacteria bacterium GW2011_GWA2_53_7]